MSNKHEGHWLVLVAEDVTVHIPATITDSGDIEAVATPIVEDWNDSTSYVFCKNCRETVRAGDDGLAEDWQFLG